MSRKRHQFLKCQNLPCNLGQALVLNETVEGVGSKFRVKRAGGGRTSSPLAAPFKALVFTSNVRGERVPLVLMALPAPKAGAVPVPPQTGGAGDPSGPGMPMGRRVTEARPSLCCQHRGTNGLHVSRGGTLPFALWPQVFDAFTFTLAPPQEGEKQRPFRLMHLQGWLP